MLLVDEQGTGVGCRRNTVREEIPCLGNSDINDDRQTHAGELLDSIIDAPQRAKVNPGHPEIREQHERLNYNTYRRARAQQKDVRISDRHVLGWVQ